VQWTGDRGRESSAKAIRAPVIIKSHLPIRLSRVGRAANVKPQHRAARGGLRYHAANPWERRLRQYQLW
jgi:hypothetical protein